MKRMSEQEALKKLKRVEGFQLDPDGWGYKCSIPDSLEWLRGLRINDQILDHDHLGLINKDAAIRMVAEADEELHMLPIDTTLMGHVVKAEVSAKAILGMSKAARDRPVITVMTSDGLQLIDGVSRIRRLYRDGLKFASAWVLHPNALWDLRITRSILDKDGQWIPADKIPESDFRKLVGFLGPIH